MMSGITLYPTSAIAHPLVDPDQSISIPVVQTTGITTKPATYTVQQGDYLSTIAPNFGVTWEALAGYNNLANPNLIVVGQVLNIPPAGYVPPAAPIVHYSNYVAPRPSYSPASSTSYSSSGLGACIINIESKGNPYIYNTSGSGAWGLYQFMPATYNHYASQIGLGGTFGTASAAQQTEVFNYAIAHGGKSNWAEC